MVVAVCPDRCAPKVNILADASARGDHARRSTRQMPVCVRRLKDVYKHPKGEDNPQSMGLIPIAPYLAHVICMVNYICTKR